MRTIVAGGRDYQLTELDKARLDSLPITELVSGGATGVDRCGEQWAESKGIPVTKFPADWKAHGKAAGPIRNRQMAQYAQAVVLFPGGRGTDSMSWEASQAGLVVHDFREWCAMCGKWTDHKSGFHFSDLNDPVNSIHHKLKLSEADAQVLKDMKPFKQKES